MESSNLKRSWECLKRIETQDDTEEESQDLNEPSELIKRSRKDNNFTESHGNAELSVSCYNREHSSGSGTDDSAETEGLDTRGRVDRPHSPSEDTTDDDDNVSVISDLSGMSSEGWRPVAAGPMGWVQQQMLCGRDPLPILRSLIPDDTHIPSQLDDLTLWKIIINLLSEPPRRDKLTHVNTLDDVVALMKSCKNIMVLTGAGVSVSCGIPDFRSRDGVYARLAQEYPDLPDPQAMFDITYFRRNPKPFYKFAKEIYPGQFMPSLCHRFIQLLENRGQLLRNYTQNIDTLEQVAGISRVIQCHGSFATATCINCKHKVDAEAIKEDIMEQVIPACRRRCDPEDPMAIMKPDIVFFGESLPEEFHRQMEVDKDKCDLLIVIGSSLKVRPVALIPNSLPADVPQILINREPLKHLTFDVELLGDCDVIVNELCHKLGDGWTQLCTTSQPAQQREPQQIQTSLTPPSENDNAQVTSTDENSQMSVTESRTDRMVDVPSDDADSTMFSVSMMGDDSCSSVNMADSASTNVVGECAMDRSDDSSVDRPAPRLQVNCVESSRADDSATLCSNMSTDSLSQIDSVSQSHISNNVSIISTERADIDNETCAMQDTFAHNQNINKCSQQPLSTSQSTEGCEVTSSWKKQNDNDVSLGGEHESGVADGSENDSMNDAESMANLWHQRRVMAKSVPESEYVFMEPCRYIFHGAEVTLDLDDDDDDSVSDSNDEEQEESFDSSSQSNQSASRLPATTLKQEISTE